MIERRTMHTAPRVTPTPMPALAPVLSPKLALGVGDDVGVEKPLLNVELDCVIEEDGDNGNKDVEENDVLDDADVDVDVEVEVEAKSANFSGAGAWKVSLVGTLQSVAPVSMWASQQCQSVSASLYTISGLGLLSFFKKKGSLS